MSATSPRSPLSARLTPTEAQLRDGTQIGTVLLLIAIGAVILASVSYLGMALDWRGAPFLGALVSRSQVVDGSIPIERDAWTALAGGIQRGDRIISIDGVVLESVPGDYNSARDALREELRSRSAGDVVEVGFMRRVTGESVRINGREICDAPVGGVASCRLRIPLSNLPETDFIALFVVPFVCGILTAGIGGLVLALRPRSTAARTISATNFQIALFMFGLFDLNTTHQFSWLWIAAAVGLGGTLILLALIFPTPMPAVHRQPILRFLPLLIALPIGVGLIALHLTTPDPTLVTPALWGAALSAEIGAFIFLIIMLRRRARATSLLVRDQTNAVIIGIGFTLGVAILWLANIIASTLTGSTLVPLNTSATMPFFVVPALAMGYAVLQYQTTDTDRILSQLVTYGLLLVGLIVGYFLLVLGASVIAQRTMGADDPILIAVLIFMIAVLFVPVRSRVQARIDQIYFRRRLNYQAKVEAFAQKLGSLVEFSDVVREYKREISETLQPSGVYIFLPNRQTGDYTEAGDSGTVTDMRFTQDSPLVQYFMRHDEPLFLEQGIPWRPELLAERSRLIILDAAALYELRGTNQANGFVVIGAPQARNGRRARSYTYEELRFVQSLTNQLSVSVERAQVIESLERRVRELDVLSQVSQAANFTIEFDDLLELINAQTTRLIDATHFYIALYDENRDELYFAFFLEDDVRYHDKEGQRWQTGRDLYSEIVRRRQAICIPSFSQAMAERGAALMFENGSLKGWMGVPLIAGARALGVLAVGTTQTKTYSDEQLKTLQDIAALAATSLDKSRLFQETNARARQLAALNDISRRLVAAEADIDKLLELITASATDILEAEAGSLLLTAEDGSGDLEFKVAIGGSGGDLIGLRVPAGRGLVGEVASTGRPIMVSNAATDPRWSGELSKGAFHTTSVLAAPLSAQNRVIGVLEVLNKKSGRGFTSDDTELLSTFAGQAAVAIENARLFRLTDEQLSARLTELETLERIDVELNRSLDLTKVAEITVRYAIANSPATAGAIGLVNDDPPHLEIVYKQGYGEDDVPEGSSPNMWMLDRGILRRVMRTRQPDLVPDVAIDPDYKPLLRGSISLVTLPMMSGGRIAALLILETDREPRMRLADMPFLQRLTEHATIAIANARLYADLARANNSKSEFVSFVAHELKNPLASVKGYASAMTMAGEISDAQRGFIETIIRNAERMRSIVDDLNDVTQLETNKMRITLKPCDFGAILQETLTTFEKRIADKNQTLSLEVPESLPLILGDQTRLIQILTNLISNAHKYTPDGGQVGIQVQVLSNRRDNKGRSLGAALQIAVSDTGIGMSKDDLAKLFTPYFRTERAKDMEEGTGLGMTLTRGLIEQHGGEIWVESEVNVGTTFYFTVPLAPEGEAVS